MDATHCDCTDRVKATATDAFLAFNKTHGISLCGIHAGQEPKVAED
jgi:hypothetical protein